MDFSEIDFEREYIELRKAYLTGKKRLKLAMNATTGECREAARRCANRMHAAAIEKWKMTEAEATEYFQRVRMFDSKGRLTPEFGGEPRKPKKKKRK